jgi:hypothetical protein
VRFDDARTLSFLQILRKQGLQKLTLTGSRPAPDRGMGRLVRWTKTNYGSSQWIETPAENNVMSRWKEILEAHASLSPPDSLDLGMRGV